MEMERETNRRRVLIVDDEAPARRTLSRILDRIQREHVLASSAEEARGLVKEETFDLILCDNNMPGESGMDFIEYVIPNYPETALIMVSGVDDPDVVGRALELGAYGYILKPFTPGEVTINISSALQRRKLETESRIYRENLEKMVEDRTSSLKKAMGGIIHAMSRTVESRDPYTSGHQQRVSKLSAAIAKEMGLPENQTEGILMAGMIHDLGKISIPAEILSKPTRLIDAEFALIQIHPQVGYDILKEIEFPWPIARIVLQHHEKMNGSGYPAGLSGEGILLEARILCVADVVEAMASHRPYRPSLGLDKALEEISGNAGKLYDLNVAKACQRLFQEKGFSFDQ